MIIHSRNGRQLSRRSLLGSLAVSTPILGGCLSYANENDGPASSSVSIINSSSFEQDVSLLVRDEDADTQLLKLVVTVPADESRRFDFEAESDEATIRIEAETEVDSAVTEQRIRTGGTTSFAVSIDRDETISIGVGMQ